MNPFVRLKKALMLIFLFTISLCGFTQQYKLSGFYPDGSKVQVNDVFLLNDSCTFFIEDELGDTVRFKSCEWIYSGQFTDLQYNPLSTVNNQNTFGFRLDESIKEYSATQLNRITVKSENSVYFSAKIKLDGITETENNVSLEFPICLNVLPNIPNVTFLELIDIGEYDPKYGDYMMPSILVHFDIDRTDRYKLIVYDDGVSFPSIYYIDFNDKEADRQLELGEYNTGFMFTAFNQFGAVQNDSILSFKKEALEAFWERTKPYKLLASYPDGKTVQAGDVFFLNDSCTFFVQNQVGDTIKFKSCKWAYEAQFSDLEYNPLNTVDNQNTFGFRLDESIKEYSSSQLNRITVKSENSVYFSAKIKLEGITEIDDNVSLEFPIYLNVLPNIPNVTFLSLLDIGEYDEQYDDYYNATILARFDIDRTDRYLVEGLPVGGIYPYGLYVDFYDKEPDKELDLVEYNTTFKFVSINQFGSVHNDSVFNFGKEALEALKQALSVNDELADKSLITIYPNPVKDFLYITGKTDRIEQLQIINSNGQLINTLFDISDSIDFTSYPKGLYIIRLVTDTGDGQIFKILKE